MFSFQAEMNTFSDQHSFYGLLWRVIAVADICTGWTEFVCIVQGARYVIYVTVLFHGSGRTERKQQYKNIHSSKWLIYCVLFCT